MTRSAVLWGGVLGVALCVISSPAAQQDIRPNVLLVTLDTVRADRLGAYGYTLGETPVLDRLAREGVRFADATSQSPLTAPAHAALLTGQYPGRMGVRNNGSSPVPESAVTLAESLRAAGYRTGAFIGAFVVDRAYGFGQGFDLFDASFEGFRQEIKQQVQRPAKQVVDPALAWIGGVRQAPRFSPGSISTTRTRHTTRRHPTARSSRGGPMTERSRTRTHSSAGFSRRSARLALSTGPSWR